MVVRIGGLMVTVKGWDVSSQASGTITCTNHHQRPSLGAWGSSDV